ARGHGAPVYRELLPGALQRVLPAGPAQLERRLGTAGHLALRRYRLPPPSGVAAGPAASRVQRGHVFRRLQTAIEPMRITPAATAASGHRRCTTWLRRPCPDASAALRFTSAVLARALDFTSAVLARALDFTSALAASS